MSDIGSEVGNIIEQPGQHHSVARKAMPKIRLRNEPLDLGQPSDEATMIEVTNVAEEQANIFLAESPAIPQHIGEFTLTSIASQVNRNFPFRDQGSGIGTIPKQLASYHTLPKEELPHHLDCKLATVMVGLITQHIAKRWNVPVKIFLSSKGESLGSHPSVVVRVPGNNESDDTLLVDFHTRKEDSESVFTVRPLNRYGKAGLEQDTVTVVPLDAKSLHDVDQAFLKE